MSQITYRGLSIDAELAPLMRHMEQVNEYRESLQSLQSVWDNLTLLGHLSATGTELGETRAAFGSLTSSLVNRLARESLRNVVSHLKAKAQMSIDIMVRNLFERTADIGFLATDTDLREFMANPASGSNKDALQQRFYEYVAKYSVYHDVVVTDPEGRVLVRLDQSYQTQMSKENFITQALRTNAYVETFGVTDLLDGQRGLIYSSRITDDKNHQVLGVLSLCFKFDDESLGIFNYLDNGDQSVVALLDEHCRVIASSDRWQLPVGAPLQASTKREYDFLFFAGNEYVATAVTTAGYQGYEGPGWIGLAMMPMQYAFRSHDAKGEAKLRRDVLVGAMQNRYMFADELRDIPLKAQRIQSDLNRSLWNGNVHQLTDASAFNHNFSKVLLQEIGNTGRKTQDVFEQSIHRLNETVVSSVVESVTFQAGLAIDIMDRNLYERANDCRWWALNSFLRRTLADGSAHQPGVAQAMGKLLQHVNSLYTVYSGLIVFDKQGRIVAGSTPELMLQVGVTLDEPWVRQALEQSSSQNYVVSDFVASPWYKGIPTYIYAASIFSPQPNHEVVGGIGIVFDAEPQFSAMLLDALPRNMDGDFLHDAWGLLVSSQGLVISSTHEEIKVGSYAPIPPEILKLSKAGRYSGVCEINGAWYAVGACMSQGYREYKSATDVYQNAVIAVMLVRLCDVTQAVTQNKHVPHETRTVQKSVHGETVEIASFYVEGRWVGIRSCHVKAAISSDGMTRMPNSADYVLGLLFYQNQAMPVIDLAALLQRQALETTEKGIVVVVDVGGGKNIGLAVNDLGEIPTVAREALQALPEAARGERPVLRHIVKGLSDAGGQMLMVIDQEQLAQQLKGGASLVSVL